MKNTRRLPSPPPAVTRAATDAALTFAFIILVIFAGYPIVTRLPLETTGRSQRANRVGKLLIKMGVKVCTSLAGDKPSNVGFYQFKSRHA